MDNSDKNGILNNIGLVYNMSENCKLDNVFFELMDRELGILADCLHITKNQALIVSVVLIKNYFGRKVDIEDLNQHFNSNPMKILEFSNDFVELNEKRFLRKNKTNRYFRQNGACEVFYINELVLEKIFKNEPIPENLIDAERLDNVFSLLEKVYEKAIQREEEGISTKELFEQTHILLKENSHFPLINRIMCFPASIDEKFLFIYVLWKFLDGERTLNVERVFKGIYDGFYERFNQIQRFLAKENNLIKEDWIEIEEATFFDDARMNLTEKALTLLNECNLKLFNNVLDKKTKENIILPSDVPCRELIYSDNETRQLNLLKSLLEEDNFKHTQKRLIQKSLPKGITVLFHGVPGTGKTESVMQIAKATNREIMKVDISATRSMWFGESEKIIKGIFNDYKSLTKKQIFAPILFFNEADAVISKRKVNDSSNVSDTENRIQNILLEEIENFEGILIATSNLTNNMDKAFERRFLFKIEFQKPSIKAKSQIWKVKMPHLSNEDCEFLSVQYDFSGGQIDNIVRKNEINEIIHGNKIDLKTLIEFCKEEVIVNQFSGKSIGFKTI